MEDNPTGCMQCKGELCLFCIERWTLWEATGFYESSGMYDEDFPPRPHPHGHAWRSGGSFAKRRAEHYEFLKRMTPMLLAHCRELEEELRKLQPTETPNTPRMSWADELMNGDD